jgi:hypothetical protein
MRTFLATTLRARGENTYPGRCDLWQIIVVEVVVVGRHGDGDVIGGAAGTVELGGFSHDLPLLLHKVNEHLKENDWGYDFPLAGMGEGSFE